jgi:hypothetical protein
MLRTKEFLNINVMKKIGINRVKIYFLKELIFCLKIIKSTNIHKNKITKEKKA